MHCVIYYGVDYLVLICVMLCNISNYHFFFIYYYVMSSKCLVGTYVII